MKVVLQDCANASAQRHGAEVELVLVLELAAVDDGRARTRHRGVRGELRRRTAAPSPSSSSCSSRAGTVRLSALPASAAAFEDTARISPVPGPHDDQVGRQGLRRPTAASAAFCTAGTSGVCTGVPGTGSTDAISCPLSVVLLSVLATVTVKPAVPASCSWKARCSPDRPSWSPSAYRGDPSSLRLLDDLGRGRADPAEQREGEAGRRGQQPGRRSGRPRRAGRRPGRGSSRSRAAAG